MTETHQEFAGKMEAVARLAGGVAHQFNNLLTAILSTADLALESRDIDPELRRDLQDIREAAMRAAAITRQLVAFSGSQSLSVRPTDVRELLGQLEPMLRHTLPANVALDVHVRSTVMVETDAVRLEQVIVSLVENAIDAVTERAAAQGGAISITAEDVEGIPATETTTEGAGPYTMITIADNGAGIAEHTRQHMFEPFYSTKEGARRGIGLGLASVYGTIHQLKGGVIVESRVGEGTRVRLYVPRVPAPAAAGTATVPQTFATPKSTAAVNPAPTEAVLVVEDEAGVRAPICRMLRHQGYYVLEANNGEDALRVMQEYHAPIHLVITDVMMPEMDGAELVSLLRDWYPRMRVLFISGYSTEYLEARGGTVRGSAFLAKPFQLGELSARVRSILDSEWDG